MINAVDEVLAASSFKKCPRCETIKPTSAFDKNKGTHDGLCSYCKPCRKEYRKLSYFKHRTTTIASVRRYYRAHRERVLTNTRLKNKSARYKQRRREAYKLRCLSDPVYKLKTRLSPMLRKAVIRQGGRKTSKTLDLLGCSYAAFKVHLESLFQPGMTWDNYGAYVAGGSMTWHIDHKRPCASFDLTDLEQQKACFHYSNLQPMWALDNIRKRDKWEVQLVKVG
jgi:hypothetical protein